MHAEPKEVRYGICGLIKTALRNHNHKINREVLENLIGKVLNLWKITKEKTETIFYLLYYFCNLCGETLEILNVNGFLRKAGLWLVHQERPEFSIIPMELGPSQLGDVNERGRKKKIFKERIK